MTKQGGFSAVEALIILLCIGIVGFGGWYIFSQNQEDEYPSNTDEQVNQAI